MLFQASRADFVGEMIVETLEKNIYSFDGELPRTRWNAVTLSALLLLDNCDNQLIPRTFENNNIMGVLV